MRNHDDSSFGEGHPKRRSMDRRADQLDNNVLLNLAVKGLTILSSVVVALVAMGQQDMKDDIKETRTEVRSAVTDIGKIAGSTNELSVRTRSLEDYRTAAEARGREMDRRVTAAETDIKHLQGRGGR